MGIILSSKTNKLTSTSVKVSKLFHTTAISDSANKLYLLRYFLFSAVAAFILLPGCNSKKTITETSEIQIWIDGNRYPCSESGHSYCNRISYEESLDNPAWQFWEGNIEGIAIKPSNLYQLMVEKTENINKRSGEKTETTYRLKKVLRKEPYRREGKKDYNFLQKLWEKGVIFYVRGNEPGWMIDFYRDGKIVFSTMSHPGLNFETHTGHVTISEKLREKSYVFQRPEASLILIGDKCEDSMSGEFFTHQATFEINGKSFSGCGMTVPDIRLNDIFVFEKMFEPEGPETHLHFKEKPYIEFNIDQLKLFGFSGCNEIGANLEFETTGISVGPVMSSRKACPGISEQEFINFFSNRKLSYELDQLELTLTDKEGRKIICRKAD